MHFHHVPLGALQGMHGQQWLGTGAVQGTWLNRKAVPSANTPGNSYHLPSSTIPPALVSPKREEAGALHEAERGLSREEAYLLLAQPLPTTCYYRREATAAATPTIVVVSTFNALANAMNASYTASSTPALVDPPRKQVKSSEAMTPRLTMKIHYRR
jgi:hypothetical protein